LTASHAPDDVNGKFTTFGWAKPFNSSGSLEREVTWSIGSDQPPAIRIMGDSR
jgi:hypothetical protein